MKSREAAAPSDFTRTDWIDYEAKDEDRFRKKLNQALDTIGELALFEDTLLDVALGARSIDCAVAFERANKAFLLTSDARFLDKAEEIGRRLEGVDELIAIADLDRLRGEIEMFVRQGRQALRAAAARA